MDASGTKVCCEFVSDFIRKRKEKVRCFVHALIVDLWKFVHAEHSQVKEQKQKAIALEGRVRDFVKKGGKKKKLKINTKLTIQT